MFTGLKRAVEMLYTAISEETHITLYGDYDVDGLNGLLCVKDFFSLINYSIYSCVEYTSRTHNVDKGVFADVVKHESKLCIIIDTGSADYDELKVIAFKSNIIVLDHHLNQFDYKVLPPCVVFVNPTALDNFDKLSGACVVYEMIMEYVRTYEPNRVPYMEKMLTYYAFSALYADGIYGNNPYCRQLYAKAKNCILPSIFSHLKHFNISKRFCLYSYAPLINSCFRNNQFTLLNRLYLSGGMQTNLDRSTLIDRAEDVRTNSRNIINSISESIKPVFVGEFALVDLSGFLNKAVDNHFIWCNKGVIASRIASQYQKCCISIVSQGSYYILSCRDYYDRDVYRILSTLYNVGGHRSAFGGTLTIQEVLHLREQLEYLSCMMAKPNDITVLDYADLTNSDIINIAGENEYLHDRDIPLVRIPVESLGSQWTPPSFSERYEQFLLDVNGTVYIKKEPFANGCKFVYISFYVTNKLNGFLINYRGDLDGAI